MSPETATRTYRGLNLGCGLSPFQSVEGFEWVNLDMVEGSGVDVVHNMTSFPWPFEDGSFDCIVSCHVFEHIPMEYVPWGGRPTDVFVAVMNECWRVLKPGGFMDIEVPTVGGNGAFQDPTHRRFMVPETWDYFSRGIPRIPNTQMKREGVGEGLYLGVYDAVTRVLVGKSEIGPAEREAMIQRMLAELDANGKKSEAQMKHDWGWHRSNIGCVTRFDALVNIVDQTKRRYGYIVLRKPRDGEE